VNASPATRVNRDWVQLPAIAAAVAAFVLSLLAWSYDDCSRAARATPSLLWAALGFWLCAIVVLIVRRRRNGRERTALIGVSAMSALTLLAGCVQQAEYPKLVTSEFLEYTATDHPINNASTFVPDYLRHFEGVDEAEIRCVVEKAGIQGPGLVPATVAELKDAAKRCGLTNLSYTYCVLSPVTEGPAQAPPGARST